MFGDSKFKSLARTASRKDGEKLQRAKCSHTSKKYFPGKGEMRVIAREKSRVQRNFLEIGEIIISLFSDDMSKRRELLGQSL